MSTSNHTLVFSKLRASFTVDKELIGKQDPYVIFTSGNSKAQTKAIRGVGTGTAEWKETYSLERFNAGSSSVIEVTVYNHNTLLPDNVIGSGTVDLANQGESSLSGSGDPVSVVLTDKKGQEVGTISFVVNGGGYTGRGRTTGTGAGVGSYGSGAATGAGVGSYGSGTGTGTGVGSYGSGTGTGTGVGSGIGSHGSNTNSGTVVGKGVGTDRTTAQKASDAAAATGKTVAIEEKNALGVGHPQTTGSGTGLTSGAGGSYGSNTTGATRGTGTGITSGTGTGITSGSRTSGTGITGGTRGSSPSSSDDENGVRRSRRTRGTGVTTGTGVTSGSAVSGVTGADRTVYGEREGDIIDRKYYVGTESRPQDQALVEQYREHNPYAKDYETTVQHTGRERLINSQIEALGTRERLIGQDHHIHAHPAEQIARHLPATGAKIPGVEEHAGAMTERPGGEGWVQTKPGPICDTNTFSITGDRTVDKERVTDLREHREFEKEFEVKTRLVGERALARGTEAEILNRERVLVDEKNKIACEGHPPAAATGGNTIASQTGGSYNTTGYTAAGTGVGSGTTTGTGTGTGTGYNQGTTGTTATGYNQGTTGSGYNTGTTGTGYNQGTTGTGYNQGTTGTTGTGYNQGTTGTTGTGYNQGTTGTGYGSGTTGSGYNQGTTGTGYNSGATGTGAGYNTGVGSGHRGTTGQTTGEKVASYIPGSEENRASKGNVGSTPGNQTAGEKAASFVPGSEENREKKAANQAQYA